ncbi:hypothetical protein [Martelella sp. FOR1707]
MKPIAIAAFYPSPRRGEGGAHAPGEGRTPDVEVTRERHDHGDAAALIRPSATFSPRGEGDG